MDMADKPTAVPTFTVHTMIDRAGNVIETRVDAADRFFLKAKKQEGYIIVNGLDEPWEKHTTRAEKEKKIDQHREEIDRRRAAHKADLDARSASKAGKDPVQETRRVIAQGVQDAKPKPKA